MLLAPGRKMRIACYLVYVEARVHTHFNVIVDV
jgi:hypothetical protein